MMVPALLMTFLSSLGAIGAPPAVAAPPDLGFYWTSHPVRPNETVVCIGYALDTLGTEAQLRIADTGAASSVPTVLHPNHNGTGMTFVIPEQFGTAVFDLFTPSGRLLTTLNAPEVWWTIGDAGSSAGTAGGWLEITGRSLAFAPDGSGSTDCVPAVAPGGPSAEAVAAVAAIGLSPGTVGPRRTPGGGGGGVGVVDKVIVTLTNADGRDTVLQPDPATCWSLRLRLPTTLPPGRYAVHVDNGLPGCGSRDSGHIIDVRPPRGWPRPGGSVFRVSAFGSVGAALEGARRGGGGVVLVDQPRVEMGDGEVLVIPDHTVLRGVSQAGGGQGGGVSTMVWSHNTAVPRVRPGVPRMASKDNPGAALLSGNGTFGVEALSIEVTSPVGAVLYFPPNSSGSWARGVNISQRFAPEVIHSNGSAIVVKGDNVTIENCLVVHGPDHCTRDHVCCSWQQSVALYINGSDGVVLRNNTILHRCQGHAAMGASRVLMQNNTIVSIGLNLSNGNGFNTMRHGEPKSTRDISFFNNFVTESPLSVARSPLRYESWTLDGPGASYVGRLESPAPGPGPPAVTATGPLPNQSHWRIGLGSGALVVMDGAGAGQVRQVLSQMGSRFLLDRPLAMPASPDSSFGVVLPWRSHFTLAGNSWVRGTTVQLFGAAWFSTIADNVAEDLSPSGRSMRPNHGFTAWGRSYGEGPQPCMFVQMLRNTLVDSGFLRTTSWDDNHSPPKPYVGAGYNRGHVHRRNRLFGTNLTIQGSATDIVVEHNVGTNNSLMLVLNVSGLHPPVNLVLRGNHFV